MQIFGRDTLGGHADLAFVCEELLGSPRYGTNDRSFAWNLVHERRVSDDWGEFWYQKYGLPHSPSALLKSLNFYHNDLREFPVPTYADVESRARNFVPRGTRDCPADHELLVRVLDLWSPGSRRVWSHARRLEMGMLGEVADLGLEKPNPPPEITAPLSTLTIDGQIPLMTIFFAALQDYLATADEERRRGGTMETLDPYWVAQWEPWKERVSASASGWGESVGLSKRPEQTPVWLAVIRYPVRRAKRLICPTQLEAHWYGRHFPTPPTCMVAAGGRVVEGRESVFSQADYLPLREYIHAPIPLEVADWVATGFPVLPTTGIVGDPIDLERDRSAHWTGLKREFSDTDSWMKRSNF